MAVALERWFQEEFSYTLVLPRTPAEATLEHFLLNRRAGHCEYFSTAMAVLLRTQGVPTREVNGFLGGEWSDLGDYLAVTQNQAHAWLEVWFPGVGWVPFDPTPAGAGTGMAGTAWFWPGRFLFDALQHRWNKWVLDYSFQTQFDLLNRGQDFLTGPTSPTEEGRDESPRGLPGGTPLWIGVAALLLLVSGLWARSGRPAFPREARLFLALREGCRRAGLPHRALRSPEAIPRFLEAAGHPAAPWAKGLVEAYLRARFSGKPVGDGERQTMVEALKEARALLRRVPLRHRGNAQSD
jgi:hypothetical protein